MVNRFKINGLTLRPRRPKPARAARGFGQSISLLPFHPRVRRHHHLRDTHAATDGTPRTAQNYDGNLEQLGPVMTEQLAALFDKN